MLHSTGQTRARANTWGPALTQRLGRLHFSLSSSHLRKMCQILWYVSLPPPSPLLKTNGFLLVSTLSPIYLDICQLIFSVPILLS